MNIKCKSVFENLVCSLKDDIVRDGLAEGSRLQPARVLAEKYNVSYVTMRRALNHLDQEGILNVRHGAGVFVKNNPESKSEELSSKKSISFVFAMLKRAIRNLPVYAELLASVERQLRSDSLECTVVYAETSDDVEALTDRETDGYILIGEDCMEGLKTAVGGKPCVWVMGAFAKEWGDHVTYNDFSVGKLAAEYLIGQGHKDLAIMTSSVCSSSFERDPGFHFCAQRNGCSVKTFSDSNVMTVNENGNYVDQSIVEVWVDEILNMDPMPTGVFVSMDAMVMIAHNIFKQKGIKVGKDIELVSCDCGEPFMSMLDPRPVSVDLVAESIGRVAVDQLKWRMNNLESPSQAIKVEPVIKKLK